jgi:Ca2+-binding EF-hand superfamily protein
MSTKRHFTEKDISVLLDKIFSTFDVDKNNRFTKAEFPRVVKTVIDLVGGEAPSEDDV